MWTKVLTERRALSRWIPPYIHHTVIIGDVLSSSSSTVSRILSAQANVTEYWKVLRLSTLVLMLLYDVIFTMLFCVIIDCTNKHTKQYAWNIHHQNVVVPLLDKIMQLRNCCVQNLNHLNRIWPTCQLRLISVLSHCLLISLTTVNFNNHFVVCVFAFLLSLYEQFYYITRNAFCGTWYICPIASSIMNDLFL